MSDRSSSDRLPGNELGRAFLAKYRQALEQVHLEVLDLDQEVEQIFIAMLADGHVILEGEPGVGKTLLVATIARTIDAKRSRIQFTPETVPSEMYYSIGSFDTTEQEGRRLLDTKLAPGPLFTQILIGDEVNRAPGRVHAPLLEPLEEKKITLEGKTTDLGDFYFFAATQNPVESSESTNELPEALRERLMLMIHVPYPSAELLRRIAVHDTRSKTITAVLTTSEIVTIQNAILEQYVLSCRQDDPVIEYIQRLIFGLHDHRATAWGPGIRAAQDVARAAAVHAFLHGNERITFADVQAIAKPTLRFKFTRDTRESRAVGITSNDHLIDTVLVNVALTSKT